MRPLQARCALGLGRLALAVGRLGEASTHLAHARNLFLATNAKRWLEEADRLFADTP
jgi:hypothetical protein